MFLPCCTDFYSQTKEEPDGYIVCWSIGQSGLRVVSASTGKICVASEAPLCAQDPKSEPELFKAGIHCVASTAFRTGSAEKFAVFALHQGGGISRLLLEKEDLLNISRSSAEDVQLNGDDVATAEADTGSVTSPAAQSSIESQATSSSTSSHQSYNADDEMDEGYVASKEEIFSPTVPLNDDLVGNVEGGPETTILVHQSHNEKEVIDDQKSGDVHLDKGSLLSMPSGVAERPSQQHVHSKSSSNSKGVKGMLNAMSKKVQAMGEALQPGRTGVEALLSSDDELNEQHPQQAVL